MPLILHGPVAADGFGDIQAHHPTDDGLQIILERSKHHRFKRAAVFIHNPLPQQNRVQFLEAKWSLMAAIASLTLAGWASRWGVRAQTSMVCPDHWGNTLTS
jgi:hypothetical protein